MPEKLFLVIVNPAAGKSKSQEKLATVSSYLHSKGISFTVYTTEEKTPELYLNSFLRKNDRITHLAVLGGDGTINLVINALPHFDYILGFLTNGTGNDSVKPLQIGHSLEQQMDILTTGKTQKIDLGRCNGRYFMNGVGIGFDGEVVKEILKRKKKRKGHWAYLSVVLKLMTGKWEWPATIVLDHGKLEQPVFSITVTKGTTFGGGFRMNPYARSSDGLLDICIFDQLNLAKRCYVLPLVQMGVHAKSGEVNFYKSTKVSISSPFRLNAHIDGEPFHSEKFELEVLPNVIRVTVP